jgi:outer membrane protein assembly factor BamB
VKLMRSVLLFLVALNPIGALSASDNWSEFRGPDGNGHAATADLSLQWSETENIAWKAAIPNRGWSSPVIHDNQIWMTTATADGHKLAAVCVDRSTGKIIHNVPVFDVETPQPIASENTYASPTPVIEEGRVYVHYGTYGTACLDTATGTILWTRRNLKCDHESGAGPNSSPLIRGNLFIVNVDGRDVQYVIALDKTNGDTVWKTERSFDYSSVLIHQRKAYSMPILIPRKNGKQLVSIGGQAIYSYDPDSGDELWKVRNNGFSIAPRPVYGLGLVFMTTDHDHPELWAVRPDGSGDVTDSHVQWKNKKGIPARSSPLLVKDLLFTVSHQGIVSCFEAETGELVWKERLDGKYSASSIYANERLYFFNEDAVCTVINPGRQYGVLATNRLDKEQLMASPAVSGDSLFVRTESHLYRVENSSSE